MMPIMSIALALATATAPVPGDGWVPVDDPYAQGLEGWVHCSFPDHRAKTCKGTEVYQKAADGTITATARGALNNDPPLAIQLSVKAVAGKGRTCTKPTAADMAKITLWAGNTKMQGKEANAMLARIRPVMAEFWLNKDICEYHFQRRGAYRTIVMINGEERPDVAEDYQWLPADNDYTLYTDTPAYGF